MFTHFIAVLVPERGGGWSVLFPDLPGCATRGKSVPEAITTAADAATAWLGASREQGEDIPAPRSYEDIRGDDAWARDRGVDWSTAVISLIQVQLAANDS
jgi:predicted RNase H-like HicB family nuclease